MHKFFVGTEDICDSAAYIYGDDVKHIYKVLRLKIGEKVSINDGNSHEFLGEIEEITKETVKVKIIEKLDINNESPVNVYLYQGFPKAAKMDMIVQKNSELGIKEIIPVITKRVVVKNEKSEFKKIDRWNRIAFEAAKQSKRSVIPKVKEVSSFENMIKDLEKMDLVLVPYENKEEVGLKRVIKNIQNDKIKSVAIVIGPEGGFEEIEIEELEKIGAYIITLGPRILRTETAGLVCTSLVMYELSDIGGII
ncbi:16S rRNA (uracil(1498)-N(3))-methyltransferase [Clostridium felsineum]|uniref:16S rRNA (uracil(1498)-N(3))-methyltransferase n=1 Tax=Clostridium felsineum TaxID=36839 RepID=UPI00098C3DF2|nr:16S rRNA (uracil(1498)-N(3))-methyltransferase [Clostridium felsineum]MCR3758199.1 16S rRNA (uracil(1498)-N(3))-methyltransferase [Clostridium felsineum]URZ15757.1 Ribosomal RNA small subunit methyltransferase E [Clostridium felsineum DSM 794]